MNAVATPAIRAPYRLGLPLVIMLIRGLTTHADQGLGNGLLGPAPETSHPVSTLAVSAYGGVGDGAGVNAPQVDPLLGGSYYTGFLAGASHTRHGPSHVFNAAAGTSYRYFPEIRELLNLEGVAMVALDSETTRRGRLRLRESVQYSRFRQFGFLPSETPASEQLTSLPTTNPEGSATVGDPFVDLTSDVNYTHLLGRRSRFQLDYVYRLNLNSEWSEHPTLHDASARYEQDAGRRASWWLQTSYRWGETAFVQEVPSIRSNDFVGGVGYEHQGTTLGASLGASMFARGSTAIPGLGRQIVGALAIGQTLGQSWHVQVDYSRRLQFVDAFPDPFASHQANAILTGQFGRRNNVRAQADYWTGVATAVTAAPDQRADGWRTLMRVGFGMARHSEMYAQYHYTSNYFSAGALQSLPAGILPRSNWGGVQVGVSVWAPLVH